MKRKGKYSSLAQNKNFVQKLAHNQGNPQNSI